MNETYLMYVIGSLLALFILYLNVAATVWLCKTEALNHFHKWVQAMIIWLVPYLGARRVLSRLYQTDPASLPRSMLGYRAFGWLETADTRNDSRTHDSGTGGHGC